MRDRPARLGGLAADIGHAIERRLRPATANREVHRTVLRIDDHVGHRKRLAADELLDLGGVACALGPQVDGAELAETPIADKQGVLILPGKFRAVAERDPGRRAGADVRDRPKAVERVGGPLARTVAEAELRPADDVVDARGSIPRFADVPLHVGVVGEQFVVAIERDIERVPQPGRDQLPLPAVRVGAGDPTLRGQRVVHETGRDAGREVVLAPVERDSGGIDLRQLGRVAADHVERLAVGREGDRVHSVLAAALDLPKQLHFVETVVAVGVADAIKAVGARSLTIA